MTGWVRNPARGGPAWNSPSNKTKGLGLFPVLFLFLIAVNVDER